MILKDTDFDVYIGVKLVANTDDGKIIEGGSLEIPIFVKWCPMKDAGKGRKRPDWDKLSFVMNRDGTKYTIPFYIHPSVVDCGDSNLIDQAFYYTTFGALFDVELHLCEIGQCKVNPSNCPGRF